MLGYWPRQKNPARQGRLSRACRTRQWRPRYGMLAWVSLWPRGSWWSAWRGPSGKTTSSLVRSSAPCLALCASRSISVPTAGRVRGRFGPPISKIGAGAVSRSQAPASLPFRCAATATGSAAPQCGAASAQPAPPGLSARSRRTGVRRSQAELEVKFILMAVTVRRTRRSSTAGRGLRGWASRTVWPCPPPAIIAPGPGGWRTPAAARCRPARRVG
jgi:hypothetical protein